MIWLLQAGAVVLVVGFVVVGLREAFRDSPWLVAVAPASAGSHPTAPARGGVMDLYCEDCNQLHRFTAGEVERVVYALVCAEADERCADNGPDRDDAGVDSMTSALCLRFVLSSMASHSLELYGESVDASVEARRVLVQDGGPYDTDPNVEDSDPLGDSHASSDGAG